MIELKITVGGRVSFRDQVQGLVDLIDNVIVRGRRVAAGNRTLQNRVFRVQRVRNGQLLCHVRRPISFPIAQETTAQHDAASIGTMGRESVG